MNKRFSRLFAGTSIGTVVAAIFIFLLTFPACDLVFRTGLDYAYIWGLNWLYANDYQTLTSLVYPLGPLAFLKHPVAVGNSALLSVIFYILVKIGFIFSCLECVWKRSVLEQIVALLLLAVASYFANLDLLIIGLSTVTLYRFLESENSWFLLPSALLFPIGIFIKSSIGLALLPTLVLTLIIYLVNHRNWQKSIAIIFGFLVIYFLIGILVFEGFTPFIKFNFSTFRLMSGYGSALALYPENNWVVLSLFLILFFALPFLFKGKSIRTLYVMQFFTAFAMWKHAILREDFSHYQILINYVVLFFVILLLFEKRRRMALALFGTALLLLLVINIPNVDKDRRFVKEVAGVNNFSETVLDFSNFVDAAAQESRVHVAINKLNAKDRAYIGDAPIDIYPCELSYVAANGLNWQPRKTLQSGGFSGWLDWKSACNFEGDGAVEFLLFHFTEDKYGGLMGSIDERYILNDEPKTLFTIFNNYEVVQQNSEWMLFKKGNKTKFKTGEISDSESFEFNRWIGVPQVKDAILRAKVELKPSLLGRLKALFYKGEACYIDYKMSDGTIRSYRFISENAKDGLWITPLTNGPTFDEMATVVDSIAFRTSNSNMFKEEVELVWVENALNIPTPNGVDLLSSSLYNNAVYFQEILDFEGEKDTSHTFYQLVDEVVFRGELSCLLNSGGYSPGVTINLDTLWSSEAVGYTLSTAVNWLSQDGAARANIVISVEDSDNDFWINTTLEGANSSWKISRLKTELERQKHQKGLLKIYVWNAGEKGLYIDDFSVVLKAID